MTTQEAEQAFLDVVEEHLDRKGDLPPREAREAGRDAALARAREMGVPFAEMAREGWSVEELKGGLRLIAKEMWS